MIKQVVTKLPPAFFKEGSICMTKVFDYIYKVILIIMIVMLVIMVSSITYNVIARFFGKAVMWIDEISRLSFVWMSFTAIVIGFSNNIHPAFEMLIEKMKATNKKILLTIINIFIIIFLAYVFKGGIDYTIKSHIQKTAILNISVGWKYLAVPFSAFIMILETIRKLVITWKQGEV